MSSFSRQPEPQRSTSTLSGRIPDASKQSKAAQYVSRRASRSLTPAQPSTANTPSTNIPRHEPTSQRRVTSSSTTTSTPRTMRTPSLVSGSSASSKPTALRRKTSGAINKYAAQKSREPAIIQMRSDSRGSDVDDCVLGISVPARYVHQASTDDLDRYRDYASSGTPSTRYAGSPFSHAPTSSSVSSCSPAITVSSGGLSRPRSRPPLSARIPSTNDTLRSGLPLVRESSTSSSNSRRAPSPYVPTAKGSTRKKLTKGAPPSTIKPPIQIPPELAHLNVESITQKSLPPRRPSRDGTPNLSGLHNTSNVVQSDLPRLYTAYHKRNSSQETPTSSVKSRFGFSSRSSSRNESPRIDSAISPPQRPSTESPSLNRKDSPAVMPSPSKSPRFGFFSRKPKSEKSENTPHDRNRRLSRPGPAAGTGHEGYGRFGIRGRSGSSISNTSFRSPSADSTGSTTTRSVSSKKGSRMSKDPVEMDEFLRQRLQPVTLRGSGSSPQATSSESSSLHSHSQPTLLPSAMKSIDSGSRRTTAETSRPSSTLAARRSLTRLSQNGSPVRIPAPINTSNGTIAHPQSHDSSVSSNPDTFHGREGVWLAPTKTPRKWNFFQRATASPRSRFQAKDINHDDQEGLAGSSHRAVAHYALMDYIDSIDLSEVEQIVGESDYEQDEPVVREPQVVAYEKRHTTLLPPPPRLEGAGSVARKLPPKEVTCRPDAHTASTHRRSSSLAVPPDESQTVSTPESIQRSFGELGHDARPSRLSPVGRIPPVISRRDRDRQLSNTSFSRPFARNQPRPSVKPPGSVYNQIRDMASPIDSGTPPINPRKEIISGNPSWTSLQQEDHWDEYNDFLDEVIALKTPTTGSSLGAPFHYASVLYNDSSAPGQPPTSALPAPPVSPRVLSVPQQISRFLQPSLSPMSPSDTITGWINGYGNRSTSTLFTDRNISSMHHGDRRDSVASSRQSRAASWHSNFASEKEKAGTEVPSLNLRHDALMTSKWLSFGRVLFSPAHNELQLAQDPRVLIIDGLGSDWSYYVAASYPRAEVYCLNFGTAAGSCPWDGTPPPPNHRHIPTSSLSGPFPFPHNLFHAVVFRFPTVTTASAYDHCIAECKRVLRPGGSLEVTLVDLDLLNGAGARVRKAVRGLKTRMQCRDPQVCLRNLSDLVVGQIAQSGFDPVQRCVVGVPVAARFSDFDSRPQQLSLFPGGNHIPDLRSDDSIAQMVARVGRWWYSTCYERALLPDHQSIWADDVLLRECEEQGASFRLLICHAQKPAETRRRTVSV